ncbi:MAG: Si-specific NAD(P)(+) transhydrogenase [Myxococcales bacterium]|nr:Si-specific NAD(P)(+) transhydrogenase [Myxococcales bacterium]
MSSATAVDVVVLGAGPAGQTAAIQAAQAGKHVVLVDEAVSVGGECVRRGTIPSKTLRETAIAVRAFESRTAGLFPLEPHAGRTLESLMSRMSAVVKAHDAFMGQRLAQNDVTLWRGRARFVEPRVVRVQMLDGSARTVTAPTVVVATGSRPRIPDGIPVDHENVLDSDSFLSMAYLPRSLTVIGAGVIASEYASIFASLGTAVTMIDKAPRPLGFLDPELSLAFVRALELAGGRYVGGALPSGVEWNGVDAVVAHLPSGEVVSSEKALVALGRVANVRALAPEAAGLTVDRRGLLSVDEHCRTGAPGVYAVGDVIGPPALASSAVEQGRRAMRHALGLPAAPGHDLVPMAVYTIPEMSSVGLTAEDAAKVGPCVVGRARFDELTRGHIAAAQDGLLKLVVAEEGRRLVGVQIVGEGAAELVHVGQMALLAKMPVDVFVDNVFNFPTLAEAYRVAALDAVRQLA